MVFGLIWIAWLNGTQYHELHGREDGRSRTYIFIQMLVLAVLAVYTGDAAGGDGDSFAYAYCVLLGVLSVQWFGVYLADAPEFRRTTGRYVGAVVLTIVVMAATAPIDDDTRLVVWAAVVGAWVLGSLATFATARTEAIGITATESMAERFGLFAIIVLGEVVVGVVDGLSESERIFTTIATGLLALLIGFGFWWNYFDFVGRRLPRSGARPLGLWIYSQLPNTMAIAAVGAGMVSLIEHAEDPRTPAETSWLLSGSVALMLVTLVLAMSTLADYERFASIYRPLTYAVLIGAAASLLVGWARPAPWLLALLLWLILMTVWAVAFERWLRIGGPAEAPA